MEVILLDRFVIYKNQLTNKIIYIQICGTITKDYYLILGNGTKNLLDRFVIYINQLTNKIIYIQICATITKDYYLIPDNDTKNLLDLIFV